MKKIITLALLSTFSLTLASCSENSTEKLYILNQGDYMDLDVIKKFETEFNIDVVYDEVPTNEDIYSKLKAGTTDYDIVIPSDYMLDRLIKEDLLIPLDYDIIGSKSAFLDDVLEISNKIDQDQKYSLPYAWGTLGIMYSLDIEEKVLENSYSIFFEEIEGVDKIGMMDSSRDAVAAALLYLGYDVNTTDLDELQEAEEALANMEYEVFADDSLKNSVVSGNLNAALVYSGDYLASAYVDAEDGIERTYGYYVPNNTNLWIDLICIPTTSQNSVAANKFIKFINEYDNALANSYFIGYSPTIEEVYETISTDENLKGITDMDNFYPYHEGMTAQVYTYNGQEHYQMLDDILTRVK